MSTLNIPESSNEGSTFHKNFPKKHLLNKIRKKVRKYSVYRRTIEAIGKYQLISGPPINIHIMHSMRHDNSPIF